MMSVSRIQIFACLAAVGIAGGKSLGPSGPLVGRCHRGPDFTAVREPGHGRFMGQHLSEHEWQRLDAEVCGQPITQPPQARGVVRRRPLVLGIGLALHPGEAADDRRASRPAPAGSC